MDDAPYPSLAEFAAGFAAGPGEAPAWLLGDPADRSILASLGLRDRVEDVLDTVVALQRAEWVQDGVYAGPHAMPEVYRAVVHAARTLKVPVPPAILAGCSPRSQGCFGTDGRAFLYLSGPWLEAATREERLFVTGRLCGQIAASHVTATTLYSLLADHDGLRSIARRGLGPWLEVFLAPLSMGVRLALSRWHRAAVLSADRAGLLVCRDPEAAGQALLALHLGARPAVTVAEYLAQLRDHQASPGRWAELLADQPFTHKRLVALDLFARSELWGRLTGAELRSPLPDAELHRRTLELLGVS